MAVHEEIHRRAIDQLKAFFGDGFPMVRRDALPANAPGHRNELEVEIFDAQGIDLLADLLDHLGTVHRGDEFFNFLFSCFRHV